MCLLSEGEANESTFAVSLRRPYVRLRWFKQLALFLARLSFLVLFVNLVYTMAAKFVSKLSFSPDDIAAADQLEPALESLLHVLKVHDSVIMAMRVNEVLHRALFTDLAQDEQQLKKCGKAFGIDASEDAEFSHQSEVATLIGAWRQAKTQSEVKRAADAAARAHGEPVCIFAMDWNSLMEKFRQTCSPDLCENGSKLL